MYQDVAASHEPYTDSEESGTESEEITDDDYDESFDEDDMTEGSESEIDEDVEHGSRASSETGEHKNSEKVIVSFNSFYETSCKGMDSHTLNHLIS